MSIIRSRREPPAFRQVSVVGTSARSDRLVRLTLAGPELAGFDVGLPAASVRLLVPDPDPGPGADPERDDGRGPGPVELPTWNGNEFLRADGSRPPIRTLTPVRFDPGALELDVEVVLHGDGPLSTWAASHPFGTSAAVAGTGRGYTIDPAARTFVLAGDESAVPAMAVLLEALPADVTVTVLIEATEPIAPVELPSHPGASVSWFGRTADDRPGDLLGAAVMDAPIDLDTRVWAAGEAAGVHRIRQHLFAERGIPRPHAVVRGYWKVGRGGDPDDG